MLCFAWTELKHVWWTACGSRVSFFSDLGVPRTRYTQSSKEKLILTSVELNSLSTTKSSGSGFQARGRKYILTSHILVHLLLPLHFGIWFAIRLDWEIETVHFCKSKIIFPRLLSWKPWWRLEHPSPMSIKLIDSQLSTFPVLTFGNVWGRLSCLGYCK